MDSKISIRLLARSDIEVVNHYNRNKKINISYIQHNIDYMKTQRNILRGDINILMIILYRQLCKTFKFILRYSYTQFLLHYYYQNDRYKFDIYNFLNLIYLSSRNLPIRCSELCIINNIICIRLI